MPDGFRPVSDERVVPFAEPALEALCEAVPCWVFAPEAVACVLADACRLLWRQGVQVQQERMALFTPACGAALAPPPDEVVVLVRARG